MIVVPRDAVGKTGLIGLPDLEVTFIRSGGILLVGNYPERHISSGIPREKWP